MKQCYKCKQIKDETDFYKNISTRDGLQTWCKACFNEYFAKPEVKQRHRKNMKKYLAKPEVKQKRKEYDRKYRQSHEVKERLREYRKSPEGKQRRHEEYKKYFAKPEVRQKHLEQQREYAATPEAKQIKKENTRRYRAKPEVKQKCRENIKRYRAKPEAQQKIKEYLSRPDVKQKRSGHSKHRRLKKKQLIEEFTIDDWKQKVDATDGICPICGKFYSEIYPFVVTLDHTPPISRVKSGYCYTINDVNPMCGSCNSSKGASF